MTKQPGKLTEVVFFHQCNVPEQMLFSMDAMPGCHFELDDYIVFFPDMTIISSPI